MKTSLFFGFLGPSSRPHLMYSMIYSLLLYFKIFYMLHPVTFIHFFYMTKPTQSACCHYFTNVLSPKSVSQLIACWTGSHRSIADPPHHALFNRMQPLDIIFNGGKFFFTWERRLSTGYRQTLEDKKRSQLNRCFLRSRQQESSGLREVDTQKRAVFHILSMRDEGRKTPANFCIRKVERMGREVSRVLCSNAAGGMRLTSLEYQ